MMKYFTFVDTKYSCMCGTLYSLEYAMKLPEARYMPSPTIIAIRRTDYTDLYECYPAVSYTHLDVYKRQRLR